MMFEYLSVLQQVDYSRLTKFYIRGRHLGYALNEHALLLSHEAPSHFVRRPNGLHLADSMATDFDSISAALEHGYQLARAAGGRFLGTPDEYMAVSFTLDPAAPIAQRKRNNNVFGLAYYGVHVNLYSRSDSGYKIWLAKRSQHVFTYQGCWDIAVGGGLYYGLTPLQGAQKEAREEANIDDALLAQMRHVRTVDQIFDRLYTHGFHIDHQYYYDLEVPESFVPTPIDNEAEAFVAVSPEEAWVILQDGEGWKHNAAVTVLDFGLRHGLYNPPAEVRAHINACLHQPVPLDDMPLDDFAA